MLKIVGSDTKAQHHSKNKFFNYKNPSFTPTPKSNISELEADIFDFIRKLRLTYHFRNSIYHDESIVKATSTFTPKPNENQELEKICKTLMETEIKMKKNNRQY